MKIKEHIVSFIYVTFFIFMLSSPSLTMEAALNGMTLFADIIFPSLFPFFVLTAMLPAISWVNFGARLFSPLMKPLFNVSGQGALVFFAGSLSGFPIEAKMTADLLKNHKISISDARRLICYTNGASPMFVIVAVAGGLMNQPTLGIVLFLCHLLGNVIIGMAAGRIIKGPSFSSYISASSKADYLTLFRESVTVSVKQLLIIGGLITFFSVCITLSEQLIISLSDGLYDEKLQLLIPGLLELSNGVEAAARISDSYLAGLVILAMISFSGLCIHMQVITFIHQLPISYRSYLISRPFHMILSPAIFVVYHFFFPVQKKDLPVLDVSGPVFNSIGFSQYATVMLLAICTFLLLHNYYKEKPRL